MEAQPGKYTDQDVAVVRRALDEAWQRADFVLDETTLACPMFVGL